MAGRNSRKMKQTFVLFMITFFITLMVVIYFIKSYSPNVDVEIGGEQANTQQTEETSEFDVKKAIDDRLKWIQLEDNMPGVSKREGDGEEDIKYETPDTKNKKDTKSEKKASNKEEQYGEEITLPQETHELINPQRIKPQAPVPPVHSAAPQPFKMTKVYVGNYSTIEQAIQAQNRLMESNHALSPFVKEVNGSYVLQVGSYASAQKAEAAVKEVNQSGFAARAVQE